MGSPQRRRRPSIRPAHQRRYWHSRLQLFSSRPTEAPGTISEIGESAEPPICYGCQKPRARLCLCPTHDSAMGVQLGYGVIHDFFLQFEVMCNTSRLPAASWLTSNGFVQECGIVVCV